MFKKLKIEVTNSKDTDNGSLEDNIMPQGVNLGAMDKEILPILALRSSVIFPGSVIPITVGRKKSQELIRNIQATEGYLGAVAQKDKDSSDPEQDELYTVGTVCKVMRVIDMQDGKLTVMLNGVSRFRIDRFVSDDPYFEAEVTRLPELLVAYSRDEFKTLMLSIANIGLDIARMTNMPSDVETALSNPDSPFSLLNYICNHFDIEDAKKQKLIEINDLLMRANLLLDIFIEMFQLVELKQNIDKRVKEDMSRQQKEYFLNQKIKAIQDELGDNSSADIDKLKKRAETKVWSDSVKAVFEKELSKFERLSSSVSEYSIQHNYLQLMLDLPWDFISQDEINLDKSKNVLDADHFGMKNIKERILEYIAVLKLKGDLKSPILCFYGPPGVGKTSLGRSIARSMNREYGRLSLGGLHDESEIRGHRRTYIGAMPGRIIQTLKKAGTSNPVIVLDEIDKLTKNSQGDPESALLEVLDPEQNSAFHDNYLDVDYDLSRVMFIATANNISNVSSALRDRMEIIDVSGYIMEEKVRIAKDHLVPKKKEDHGLEADAFILEDALLATIITDYTKESGVRGLDKVIAKIARKIAMNIGSNIEYEKVISLESLRIILGEPKYLYDTIVANNTPGVATGLAWTSVGGETLTIETSLSHGKGVFALTGSLGDVMKESINLALSWVKSNTDLLNIDYKLFEKINIHLHIPSGATPKDGPSAGITLVSALVSLLTRRCVYNDVAMTGELSLTGKVMPIGGLKEKILAAKRYGIKKIILCKENHKDLEEIEKVYIDGLEFFFVSHITEVLNIALEPVTTENSSQYQELLAKFIGTAKDEK